jgi:hypothetical protein
MNKRYWLFFLLLLFLLLCVERMAMTTPKKKIATLNRVCARTHTHEVLCRLEQKTKEKKAFAAVTLLVISSFLFFL